MGRWHMMLSCENRDLCSFVVDIDGISIDICNGVFGLETSERVGCPFAARHLSCSLNQTSVRGAELVCVELKS